MRTTIDLPDSLFTEMKTRAAREGKSLKDVFLQVVLVGMKAPTTAAAAKSKNFPTISGADGELLHQISPEILKNLENKDDLERFHRSV